MTAEPLAELGRRLREAREKKGWTLQQAAERTRITAKNLGSIEAGDLTKFPAAVYVRGFVRSYANALDLKEEEELAWLDAAGFTAPSAAVAKPGVPAVEPSAVLPGGVAPAGADEPLRVPWARFVPPPKTILLGVGVLLVAVLLGVGVRGFMRWLKPPSDGPVPPSPFQQQAAVPAKAPETALRLPAPRPAAPAPLVAAPAASALATGVFLSVTANAVCEIQYQIDAQRARWMTLKPGEFTVLKAKSQLRLLVGNPAGIVMSTPQGPVPLPRTSHRAEHLLLTPGSVQKLALPGASPALP